MKAGNESAHAHALAQEYMTKLVHESAPASYLPMLAELVQTPTQPVPLQVGHLIFWTYSWVVCSSGACCTLQNRIARLKPLAQSGYNCISTYI